MAQTIGSDDLGTDQTKNQIGQADTTQAGQAPVQNNSQAPTISGSNTGGASDPNKQQGSGYTNIQKVIQANQGNQLGSAVGNNIQQVGNAASDNLKNAQGTFDQQSQANQFNTDQNRQTVSNVLNDPTQFNTQDPNAANYQQGNQFKTLISGQYQGPTDLANSGQIQSQANNAAQMGQALGSAGGRIGLLQQIVGNPQYQSGEQNLDNLLLGQSKDPSLQAARRQSLTLQGQTNNAIAGAQAQGQQFGSEAKAFGNDVQNQLGQNVSTQNTNLQNQATQSQSDRDANYQKTLADLKSGKISQGEADQLGLTQGENVFNTLNDPSKFMTESALKASAQNVASSNDYAKMQALQNLSGQYANQDTKNVFGQYQDPSQAGRFASDQAMTGDKAGFQNALDSTSSNYNSILNPAQSRLASSQALSNLVQQRDAAGGMGTEAGRNIQYQIANRFPGAATNGWTRSDWAQTELQKAQQNMTNTQQQLSSAYGTPTNIDIQPDPSAYPNINALNQNS